MSCENIHMARIYIYESEVYEWSANATSVGIDEMPLSDEEADTVMKLSKALTNNMQKKVATITY